MLMPRQLIMWFISDVFDEICGAITSSNDLN